MTLRDYLGFICNDDGTLRRHIFDWNVRDYAGGVEVNREIKESLLDRSAPQFWWLNNGVTITCSRAWTRNIHPSTASSRFES
ncbi:AIPR family protein [Streptomyces griseoviridis]